MAIMNDVFRVSVIGNGPGAEQFDVSFWMSLGAPTTAAAANTMAGQIRDAWVTSAAANWRSLLSNDQTYREVRLYSYPNGGPTASVIGSAPIVTGGGIGTLNGPLQQCVVVTLRTAFAGRRYRGRMYLPAAGVSPGTGHVLVSTVPTGLVAATANFFNACNAIATVGDVAVVSQVGAGMSNKVTELRVDDKVDIQRRRANKQLAVTSATAIVV